MSPSTSGFAKLVSGETSWGLVKTLVQVISRMLAFRDESSLETLLTMHSHGCLIALVCASERTPLPRHTGHNETTGIIAAEADYHGCCNLSWHQINSPKFGFEPPTL